MRIDLVGNQGNNAYRLCKWLREAGVDARLHLLDGESNERSQPAHVDRELASGEWPDWLKRLPGTPRQSRVGWREVLTPSWPEEIADLESDTDLVLTSGFHGLFAATAFQKVPVVHFSLGSEVTDLPVRLFGRGERRKIRWEALLARRSLAHVRAVLTSYSRTVLTLHGLGHAHKTRPWGFPEDLDGNVDRIDRELLAELDAQYADYDAVFLWFSRLNFRDPKRADYKGPERFLAAYETLVADGKANVRALIGAHGTDADAFREQVASRGLEDHVDFVPHLPYWKLLTYLSLRNGVVFDLIDVEKGTPGGLVREALSVRAPVVMALDRKSLDVFYGPGCPMLDAPDATQCHQAMRQWLAFSPEERSAYARDCAEWARRVLDRHRATERLLAILREVIYCTEIPRQFEAWAGRDLAAEARVSR